MIEFKAKIKSIAKSVFSQKTEMMLELDSVPVEVVEELIESDLRVNVRKWRDRRSNDANSYFWVLVDKLAYKLNKSKTDVYRAYVKDIGGVSETVCVRDKAVDDLCKAWQSKGLGWQTDTFESKIEGCTNVILYYGQSMYDTAQMSRLLDLVIQDCEAVGIPTITPKEVEALKQRWGE